MVSKKNIVVLTEDETKAVKTVRKLLKKLTRIHDKLDKETEAAYDISFEAACEAEVVVSKFEKECFKHYIDFDEHKAFISIISNCS